MAFVFSVFNLDNIFLLKKSTHSLYRDSHVALFSFCAAGAGASVWAAAGGVDFWVAGGLACAAGAGGGVDAGFGAGAAAACCCA